MELMEKLKVINTIPNVNRGGCGVVAKHLYYAILENKHPHKKFSVYYILHNRDCELIPRLRDRVPIAPTHVVVRYGKDFLDSCGVINVKSEFPNHQLHPVSIEYLEDSLKNPYNAWNPKYSTRNNSIIKKTFKPKQSLLGRIFSRILNANPKS